MHLPVNLSNGHLMNANNLPTHLYNSHEEALEAVRTLAKAGFDLKKLSLIGKGYHSEEQPVGFYTLGDRVKSWGGVGALWGGIWGLLLAPAVFFIPGLGLIAMAGPVVATLVGALEGAVVVGGLSALGAALTQLGVPKDQIMKYETALKVDKYLLVVHGTQEEVGQADDILTRTEHSLAV